MKNPLSAAIFAPMTLTTCLLLVLAGLIIGTFSGMVGIGGGVLVIPVLIFVFGFEQARANGTSLAMLLPPIGIFAVLAYARAGQVEWRYALLMAVGFAAGAYVGARLVSAGLVNMTALRISFSMLLLYCAGRILFRPGGRAFAAVETGALMVAFGISYFVMRYFGRRLMRGNNPWTHIYRSRQKEPFINDYEI